jgi:5-formyltetrahydrofolate cyclo-ligase
VAATKDKPAWRAELLAARALVPASVRRAEASALASWVRRLSGTVCAYHPIGTEPGSTLLLDALVAAGCRVLLPVVTVRSAALDWALYTGGGAELSVGPYGLPEPVGDRLGPGAVGLADTVLVPALAVDRRGVRLGRGAGYYDRTLVRAAPDASLVAVVRDPEVVAELPSDPHDIRMTAALTPAAGFTPLP